MRRTLTRQSAAIVNYDHHSARPWKRSGGTHARAKHKKKHGQGQRASFSRQFSILYEAEAETNAALTETSTCPLSVMSCSRSASIGLHNSLYRGVYIELERPCVGSRVEVAGMRGFR